LLSDDDPRPLTTLAQQRVELGTAYCDGAAVGEPARPDDQKRKLELVVETARQVWG
jgi:hypothetical protein